MPCMPPDTVYPAMINSNFVALSYLSIDNTVFTLSRVYVPKSIKNWSKQAGL